MVTNMDFKQKMKTSMLPVSVYNNLWTATLGMPIQTIPCHYQYLQREVYFQDYLDLFCCPPGGNETFQRVQINGHQTVDIPNLPPDPTGAYTVIDPATGNLRLIVDYDFPYNGQLGKNRKIQYILIGEAAPKPAAPKMNAKGDDKANSYFYNTKHINSTSYFSEPVDAFGILGNTKTNKLIRLADKGVLLLDLLPYAIKYSTQLRSRLNKRGNTQDFWDNPVNPYSLFSRMSGFIGCLHSGWDLSLMATPTISNYIVEPINGFAPIAIPGNPGVHPVEFRTLRPNVNRYRASDYRKVTNSNNPGALYGPTAKLIQDSF
jgi:hypothetical protein